MVLSDRFQNKYGRNVVFYAKPLGLSKLFGSDLEGFIGYKLDNVQVIIEPEEKGEFESARYIGFSIELANLNQF